MLIHGIHVWADPSYVKRIVRTLLENAMKYTPEGGRVTVRLSREGDRCMLEVSNTGEGIPEEDLKHVFDRFYRADSSRTRKGGFGLGLSIAQDLAMADDAEIKVSSVEGESATFIAEWPIR